MVTGMDEAALNVYQRMTEYICFLSAYDDETDKSGCSAADISGRTGTPAGIIRQDLIGLSEAGLPIGPASAIRAIKERRDGWEEEIVYLTDDVPMADYSTPYLLFVEKKEADLLSASPLSDIWFKESPSDAAAGIQERLIDIETAIRMNRKIDFMYKSPAIGAVEHITAAPIQTFYNRNNNIWYLITFPDDELVYIYRLDRIKPKSAGRDIRILSESFLPPRKDDKRLLRFQYMWGMEYDNTGEEPMQVKLRISPDTGNIVRKIRLETKDRAFAKLYEKDGYWYYEDKVIGLYAFKSWVQSFGSSIKVLEPEILVEAIRVEAQKALENYGIFFGG